MGSNCAVIVAAGRGKRMKKGINKQFIDIKGKPMLYYSINSFNKSPLIDSIVIVCEKNEIEYCRENVIKKYDLNKVTKIVEGGKERQNSVFNGLKVLKNCEIVLIHDGARPFVTENIIQDGIRYAGVYGACACGMKPKDTIKSRGENGFSQGTLSREKLFLVQTPQCFKYSLIYDCHRRAVNDGIQATDDTIVAEHYGNRVYLYEGSYDNIKITTPEDLSIAEVIFENRVPVDFN
ncbi:MULTISPECIES: 2-C-methyl-D-erythritol 4-phosphate cytidylyltransferase [Clostridium]|jgi:2-C-methyl-D-erythritol 4-phosphate cytidylyltransferase|uniref:2-C-methyl-D-erythritol 4-phosphate cytidylyltransferase n=1 Tax=Clostridium lapidicellarium TaxID=3240931 RepID=A0ABV4E056_9CLOT|nr:2-C-methyl-D-erythritol 4-phosphate cytidylyltransferase [uncultured Clostridium sp.]NLU07697.1 2-C-methyl-D-erythritol 4-phosphate cytidylyltransferase [Clostridiales bacterium]